MLARPHINWACCSLVHDPLAYRIEEEEKPVLALVLLPRSPGPLVVLTAAAVELYLTAGRSPFDVNFVDSKTGKAWYLKTGQSRHAPEALRCRYGVSEFWGSSGVEGEVRMEDGGCVNVARINRGRVCM